MSVVASSGSGGSAASINGQFRSEEEIQNLIENQLHENVSLEYKSGFLADDKNRRGSELAEAVSALANSQGGTLLIGIKTRKESGRGNERPEIPDRIDGVDRSVLSRETIDNILVSNIQPKVPDVEIYEIALSGDLSGKVVYQLTVPVSRFAPHMVSNRYYKRTATATRPMEHYEVEDVRGRRAGPRLEVALSLSTDSEGQAHNTGRLTCAVRNTSEVTALFALVRIYLDVSVSVVDKGGFEISDLNPKESLEIHGISFGPGVMLLYKVNANNTSMPLWGNIAFDVTPPATLKFYKSGFKERLAIVARVDSPDMKPQFHAREIKLINGFIGLGSELSCDPDWLASTFH